MNGAIALDKALRAVGQPLQILATNKSWLSKIDWNAVKGWSRGAREWLEEIARGAGSASGGAARRLENLRNLAVTFGFAESVPEDLWRIVQEGLAQDFTEAICVLGGLDLNEVKRDAKAFITKYPLPEKNDGMARLFDGVDRGLTRWLVGSARQPLRDQLV